MPIERVFGMLKGRFRILLKRINSPLCHMPDLVMACICLHNVCIANSNGFDMDWALDAERKKHKQKQIQHLATSKELICSKWLKKQSNKCRGYKIQG